eukprot:3249677-Prymnesium_polylepis.1
MFYKNILIAGAMYIYSLFAMASGTRLFTGFFLEAHSIFYTSLPIIIFAINDMDVPKKIAAAEPGLYTAGIERRYYTHFAFGCCVAEAIFASLACVFVPMYCFGWPGGSLAFSDDGDASFSAVSFTSMCALIIAGNSRLVLEMRSWTVLEQFAFWSMLLLFEISTFIFSYVSGPAADSSFNWKELEGVMPELYVDWTWWFTLVLTILVVLFPALVGRAWGFIYHPSESARVLQRLPELQRKADQKLQGLWNENDGFVHGSIISEARVDQAA